MRSPLRRCAVLLALAWLAGAPAAHAAEPSEAKEDGWIGVLLHAGFVTSEASAASVVFGKSRAIGPFPWRLATIAATREPVRSAEGMVVVPDFDFADSPPLDVLVVPALEDMGPALANPAVVDFVRRSAGNARSVVGICSGVSLLGAAGLLDGRRATTFPGGHARLQARYPEARLEEADIVQDGLLLTVSGELVTYEALLRLVESLAGPRLAARVREAIFLDALVTEARPPAERTAPAR